MPPLYLGIDIGTSGVRTAVINASGERVSFSACPMAAPVLIEGRPAQDPEVWWAAVSECIRRQAAALHAMGRSPGEIAALAVDGTSGTMLLADSNLAPITPGLMYNSAGFTAEAEVIARHAPPLSIARGASSALARMLHLQGVDSGRRARFCLHQADWIMARLSGDGGHSDENNVLKLGYDVAARQWPGWLEACGARMDLLPEVHPAGAAIAMIGRRAAEAFGFAPSTRVHAGTTDSTAAFLASGAAQPGGAVTSAGTTLAIKLLSARPVEDASRGIYSHRIGGLWLAGGASNSGGGVLRRFFSVDQIVALSAQICPDQPSGLDYYPLICPGERFPVNDPALAPRLAPRPADDVQFLHGLLEGMAHIEAAGYRALAALGCPYPVRVLTAGGGAVNAAWIAIRERILGVTVLRSPLDDAATGAARLAAGITGL